jgi:hypothetical protein
MVARAEALHDLVVRGQARPTPAIGKRIETMARDLASLMHAASIIDRTMARDAA